ncbi:zf-HC2 domain-containing protein [Actinophytocola oryzae]|uniref:Putative zinc finger protein n=1 Tax=Actinophytocola oryzae TaxID=502181 RepID=A0A4R7VQA2_9PSEU|nr:zf-HC2 domain-containing protein [Actinophytocola oryzae]TDV51920.1 putative zinc finger protein [Actinophytocola oryzae]
MTWHASTELLHRYADGDPALATDVAWAVEVHLESCADCRARLAAEATEVAPLVEQVWAGLDLAPEPAPVRGRLWLTTWATPAMAPWLAMTVLVTLAAVVADWLTDGTYPSIALLLAPVAPVAGVAAAWARGMDPAHELVAATPRAGLYLVLRRTLAVLVVVIPLLALGTWTSPVRWLLPCLAFTVATLALGGFVGLRRAAVGLVVAWALFVVGPSLVTARVPVVLEPAALGVWAAVTVVCAAVVRLRATVYTRLES